MTEAARRVRDELQRVPINGPDPEAAGGRTITTKAIARCARRNGIAMAEKPVASTADGKQPLLSELGQASPRDQDIFAQRTHGLNYEFLQVEARTAEKQGIRIGLPRLGVCSR